MFFAFFCCFFVVLVAILLFLLGAFCEMLLACFFEKKVFVIQMVINGNMLGFLPQMRFLTVKIGFFLDFTGFAID